MDSADLSEESFSEYHLYSLGRPATLRGSEQQSFTMIEPRAVKVTPRYVYRGGDARGVMSQMVIVNAKDAGLGVPLPAGRVRFYEPDADGVPAVRRREHASSTRRRGRSWSWRWARPSTWRPSGP